jgi:hypothetical protein
VAHVRSAALFVGLLGWLAVPGHASADDDEELPRGVVIPRVECRSGPQHSYSLYLPSGYSASRRWPVVYGFSPGGDGSRPVRLLQEAAEAYGYVLVGSNDARNGPWEPVIAAQGALWKDVNHRFAIDPHRSYATGFSGGSRAAIEMALAHRRQFAGLILAGAALSPLTPYPRGGGLFVYALVGDGDLNLPEHLDAERQLRERGYAEWLEVFEGGHQWPSPERYRDAIELLEVAAMERGWRPRDRALLTRLAAERLASDRHLAKSGRPLLALRGFRQTAERFPGTAAGREAKAAAAALAQDSGLADRQRTEKAFVEDVRRLQRYDDRTGFREAVDRMKARMEGGGPLSTRARLGLHLSSIFLEQTGVDFLQRGDPERAIPNLMVAAAVYPGNAGAAYNAACALALTGKPELCLQQLRSAAEGGFNDVELLDSDPDLASIRALPEFAALRDRVVRNREQGRAPERYPFVAEGEP